MATLDDDPPGAEAAPLKTLQPIGEGVREDAPKAVGTVCRRNARMTAAILDFWRSADRD